MFRSAFARRFLLALIAVFATLASGVLVAQAAKSSKAPKPKELKVACASKSTGGLRYVTKASACKSSETPVDFRTQFVNTCIKQHGQRRGTARYRRLPAGSTRLVADLSLCAPETQPNEQALLLPSTSRTWFCVRRSDGRLRWVNRKPKCSRSEFPAYLNGKTPPAPVSGGDTPTAPANRPPVAVDDSASTDEHSARTLSVLGNDTDADSDPLRVASVDTNGTKGSAVANADGTISYDPNGKFESLKPGESASDTFRYTAADPDGASSNPGTVTVTITGLNDAPNAVADAAATDESSAKSFSLTANDTDADGDAISIGSLDLGGTQGQVTPHSDGTVTYDPNGKFEDLGVNESRQDVFKYKASDGTADSAPTNVVVTVAGVNDAPVVATTNSTLAYAEDGDPEPVDPGATVSDADGDAIHGASVQITGNHRPGEDVLAFTDGNGISGSYDAATGKLTLTGDASLADYQAALRSVTYANTSKNPSTATRTVTFAVSDVNLADSAPATRMISVAPVNDAPVVTTTNGSTSYTENGAAVTVDGGVDVADVDSTIASAEVKVSAGFQVGDKLNYSGSYSSSYDSATGVLTLQHAGASPAEFRDELRKVAFESSVDDPPASKTISFTVNDGDKDSAPATKTIAITAVNDAPVNTVPAAQGVNEDTDLAITGLSVADVDAGTAQIKADVSVSHGTLRRSSGGTPAASLSFSGTQAEVNTALSELVYKGAADYNGSDLLTIVSDDQGHTGSGGTKTDTDSVAITVNAQNDGPVNHVPGAQTTDEDTALTFTGANAITVSDVDSDPDEVKVDLTVGQGKLTLGSTANLTVTNDGSGHVTLQGTQAAVNAGLNGTKYAPDADYNGPDTLTVKTDDLGHNGDGGAIDATNTVAITVTAVNDRPVLSVPGAQTIDEDTTLTLDGGKAIKITDVDAGNEAMSLFLTVSHGKLHLPSTDGLTFTDGTSNDSANIHVDGTRAALESALDGLTYTPDADYAGDESLSLVVEDNGYSGAGMLNKNDAKSVGITVSPVNDKPVVTTSGGSTAYTENDTVGVAVDGALTISDGDDANLEGATVVIANNRQTGDELSFTNTPEIVSSYNASTGTLTLTGTDTVANYQAALRSVKFTSTNEDPSATRSISFTVNDGDADSVPAAKTIAITAVNDAPTVTVSSGQANYTENGPGVAPDPDVTVSDVDDSTFSRADLRIVSGYDPSTDLLTASDPHGLTVQWSPGTGSLTLTGTATKADYQAALRSVRFTASGDNPSSSPRPIAFRVTDSHGTNSPDAFRNLTVTPVNDKPVVTTSSGSSSFTEGSAPATVDPGLTVADPDSPNLASAQVEISSGTVQNGDVLSFTAAGNITGSYNPTTHVLSLSGTDTQANYQAALRSVKFSNSTSTPGSVTRRIAFRVNDGSLTSTDATRDVTVTEVNSAPVVATSSGTTSFVEDGGPVTVDSGLSVTDGDSTTLAGATVEIAGGRSADDSLAFTDTANITGIYTNGRLTLSGTDTVANYQAALRSVKFANGSDSPSTATRSITFQVDDGQPVNHASNVSTKSLSVSAVNDKPVVTPSSAGTPTYVEDGSPVTVDGGITVSDVDSMTLSGVGVSISSNFSSGDVLSATSANGITATYNASSGILVLSGPATPAQYSSVLRTVAFSSTSQNPSTAARTLSYVAYEGAAFNSSSTPATRQVNVAAVNDAPVLTQPDGALTYTEDSPSENHADAIAPNLTLSDVDDTSFAGATVALATLTPGDELVFTNQSGITGSYNTGTGVLTLSGQATRNSYEGALRSVNYRNTSENPAAGTRGVTFRVNDGHGVNNLSNEVTRNITLVPTNDAPSASNFTFDGAKRAVGNTSLVVDDPTDGAPDPAGPQKTVTGDLLAGASDPDSPSSQLTVHDGTFATDQGGRITFQADGDFTYLPPKGCAAATDSTTYEVFDNDSGSNRFGKGTLNFAIADCVWYVVGGPDAPPSETAGTSQTPFNSLTGVNGAGGTGDSDGTGDTLFLAPGIYTGGLPLEANQRLLSKRHGLTFPDGASGTTTLEPAAPAGGGSTVQGGLVLTTGNTLQGIDLGTNTSGYALSGSSVGTATVNTATSGSINNTSGGAVGITGTGNTLNMAFSSISSTGGASGIAIANASGTFTGGDSGTIQSATGTDVSLSGGTLDFTLGSAVTDAASELVNVTNQTGGAKTFNGALTGGSVSLTSNTGASLRFGGGMALTPVTTRGFTATGGGTLAVTGTNTIDSTSGGALSVQNTTVGTDGLTFQRLAANGAAQGVVLNNTGPNDALSVTGTGTGTCTAADQSGCTGGTIQNTTGGDDSSTTPVGTAVVLKDTHGVSLTRMNLKNNSNYGIRGDNVSGSFRLLTSVVNGTNGSETAQGAGSPYRESAVRFTGLTGTNTINSSAVSGGAADNIGIQNSSGTLARLSMQGNTIGDNSATQGNHAVGIEATGTATVNVTVDGNVFTGARAGHFDYVSGGSGGDVAFAHNTMSQSRLTSGAGAPATGAGMVRIVNDATANTTINVASNTMTGSTGAAILVAHGSGSGTLSGSVTGNSIGTAGTANSGSLEGDGIQLNHVGGPGSTAVAITDNFVRQYNNFGIGLVAGGSGVASDSGNVSATVTGNTVANPGTNANINSIFQGIHLNSATTPGQSFNWCANIKGNSIVGSGRNSGTDFRLRQRQSTTVRLPGYTGATGLGASVQSGVTTFIQNQNDANPNSSAAEAPVPTGASLTDAGGGFTGGAACSSG